VDRTPDVSVVVVVHDMARELPRTLYSLTEGQQGIEPERSEVVVVDNGSSDPLDPALAHRFGVEVRIERIDPAPPSPVRAANHGLALARGALVGLFVDGARLASPGLLAGAQRAARLSERPVITAPAFHLGSVRHMEAAATGYDQRAEDELLAGSAWEADGYRLFGISTLGG
jgi:glycosyltransferase involved in cell wall biosynthesis